MRNTQPNDGRERIGSAGAAGVRSTSFALIQDENGVDLTLIRENLRLSPAERLRRAEAAKRQAMWIREHAQRIR